jgi:hypothetical protein
MSKYHWYFCGQGCRLQGEDGAHSDIWWEPVSAWPTQFQFVSNIHVSAQEGAMIEYCHYQGHLEVHVGACLWRSCVGCSAGHQGGRVCQATQAVRNWWDMGRVHVGIHAKQVELSLPYDVNWVRDRTKFSRCSFLIRNCSTWCMLTLRMHQANGGVVDGDVLSEFNGAWESRIWHCRVLCWSGGQGKWNILTMCWC